ncbi:MAG: hypothetical protein AAFZ06_11375 [Pseudomonadota bacterium]
MSDPRPATVPTASRTCRADVGQASGPRPDAVPAAPRGRDAERATPRADHAGITRRG